MMLLKRVKVFLLLVVFCFSFIITNLSALATTTNVWTEGSFIAVSQSVTKPASAPTAISWVAAKNESESAQILLRSDTAFTINSVAFSSLTGGSNTINSSMLSYNYQEYNYYTKGDYQKGAYYHPDALLNTSSVSVGANKTQGIWITVHVPKNAVPLTYTGTVTVNTTVGTFYVNMALEVSDVTVPDPKDGKFEYEFWNYNFNGMWPVPLEPDYISQQYGYTRYSSQWWTLNEKMAKNMADSRMNILLVRTLELLFDGGTTINGTGQYTFNWSKFDQFVQTYLDYGSIKRLAGFQLGTNWSTLQVYLLKRDASNNMVMAREDCGSSAANNWLDQFLPALKSHLDSKSWTSMWYQHISDETEAGQVSNYNSIVTKVKQYMGSSMKCGDATYQSPSAGFERDIHIPITDTFQSYSSEYYSLMNAGKEIWSYMFFNPGLDEGGFMNKMTDYPLYQGRMIGWASWYLNLKSFLHWGYNYWDTGNTTCGYGQDVTYPGDGYNIYPDPANATIKGTIREIALRDGAEDAELLMILDAKDHSLATAICGSVATRFNSFTTDVVLMKQKHEELVRAAASDSTSTIWNDNNSNIHYYAGTWTNAPWTGCYNNDTTHSNTANSYAEYIFTGTNTKIYAAKGNWCGDIMVSIDGGTATTLSTYDVSGGLLQQLVYDSGTLSNASHTLRITVVGNGWLELDYVQFTSNGSSITVGNTTAISDSQTFDITAAGSTDWVLPNVDEKSGGTTISISGNSSYYQDVTTYPQYSYTNGTTYTGTQTNRAYYRYDSPTTSISVPAGSGSVTIWIGTGTTTDAQYNATLGSATTGNISFGNRQKIVLNYTAAASDTIQITMNRGSNGNAGVFAVAK